MPWAKVSAIILLLTHVAVAFCASSNNDLKRFDAHPDRGWYFYAVTPTLKKVPRIKNALPHAIKKQPMTKAQKCRIPGTWTAECGFVDPTTVGLSPDAVWQFEQKEYHELLHRYSLFPNNLQEVYHFQKFKYWALTQAMNASYTAQYNREQHPDINASITAPVSQFGLAVIKQIEQKSETAFWRTLSKTAFYVLVSRTGNVECQAQGRLMLMLSREEGVKVWNLSVDKGHLKGFANVMHFYALSSSQQKALASHLRLQWLPTIYLYLKPAEGSGKVGRWIRVATGITTLDAIKSRTINFVEAYRHAIVQGAGESAHKVPNFAADHLYPLVGNTAQSQPVKGDK